MMKAVCIKATMVERLYLSLAFLAPSLFIHCGGFVPFVTTLFSCGERDFVGVNRGFSLQSTTNDDLKPIACLVGYVPSDQEDELKGILLNAGYGNVVSEANDAPADGDTSTVVYKYKYIKASAMLKLVEGVNILGTKAPKYIPVQSGEENVLVANGWSFLDPDESEPMSSFDVDAANAEGQYKPKWGSHIDCNDDGYPLKNDILNLSSLGYDLGCLSTDQILSEAESINIQSKKTLLDGGTDQPNKKVTNNGYDFSGSLTAIEAGLFHCAIGSLPLFTTADLHPLTGSSGWLSFVRPVAEDHVKLIHPDKNANDKRIEVVDARTGCHLGHYFESDGYCINASALNFTPQNDKIDDGRFSKVMTPLSWQKLWESDEMLSSSEQVLKRALLQHSNCQEVLFGAGCFWHVEFALRRLPGIIDTKVGYAGGNIPSPTYKDVCSGDTNHAEVVKVTFDPTICDSRKLIDCWLAMHDPTIVRAHGKKAKSTGQYRSCIYVFDQELKEIANSALTECRTQLAKILSTNIEIISPDSFWVAEERHQRHDERRNKVNQGSIGTNIHTLSINEWLLKYGRRSTSIWGSSETMNTGIDDPVDDGMARMMI